jgi:phytoene synthase
MQACRRITRKSASNLAMAFVLLPPDKREGMSALYAFCREVDDVADEDRIPVDQRRQQLRVWRDDVRKACAQGEPQLAVNRELQSVIRQYRLPFELFDEVILGVEMDLTIIRYSTYSDLELYCYRVASAVGLLSIEIFGYRDPQCREYAIALGKALQLTNILRDVSRDAQRGRIYLPQEVLSQFHVDEEDLLAGRFSNAYFSAARHVAQRAREHYHAARALLPPGDRQSMIAAELMGAVYWRLLQHLEQRKFNVFETEPARVSKPIKAWLILRTWLRLRCHSPRWNYGGLDRLPK